MFVQFMYLCISCLELEMLGCMGQIQASQLSGLAAVLAPLQKLWNYMEVTAVPTKKRGR